MNLYRPTCCERVSRAATMRASNPLLALALLALAALQIGCGGFEDAGPPSPVSVAPARGPTTGGQRVAIRGHDFADGAAVLFDGVPATDVSVLSDAVITAIVPAHPEGRATITVFDAAGRSAELVDAYEYVRSFGTEGRPRVVSAVSTSNTTVRVIFSEPVQEGADQVDNFRISHANVNPESGTLIVRSATPSEDFIWVDLETSAQNEVIYSLAASNIRDFDGNLLAPPELLVNPSVVTFAGTPPSGDQLVDEDGDGLYDNVEVAGWTVTVFLTNGDVVQRTVTSDPTRADSDADGLRDADELVAGTDPRGADTDGDMVNDFDEWNVWWSNPCDQDSDDDELADGIEVWLQTSAILDDTDGDGVEDGTEQLTLSRDPLIADLPRPRIIIGSYDFQVDIVNSYTDESGTVFASETSTGTSFSQSTASSVSRSDTRSTESANRFSQNFGTEFGFGGGATLWSGKISASVGFEQSFANGYSSTVSSDSSRQASEGWDRSVSEAFEQSQSRAVTRTVAGARIVATASVANDARIPFTISNLEIAVLRQDRAAGGGFRPVGTLRPRSELSINLGPLDGERGPIVFEDSEVFPSVVDELLREPTGVIFKVSNFDVTDEDGRNFAYTSATVSSRTAAITIDYGDGRSTSHRVATHAPFDERGRPSGITITRALEILGLSVRAGDRALGAEPAGGWPAEITSSLGTAMSDDGVERLVRVGSTQNAMDGAEKRYWTVLTNATTVTELTNFSDIQLRAGEEYLIAYVRDLDEDGLYDREELLYGSSDLRADTDSDGLSDAEEVREGSQVSVSMSTAYLAFSSPARADTDGDGVLDPAERIAGTDPGRADSDSDAVADGIELGALLEVELFDGDLDDLNNGFLTLLPYSDLVLFDGGNGAFDGVVAGDDVLFNPPSDGVWLDAGPNGVIDSLAAGDDRVGLLPAIAPGPDGSCQAAVLGGDDVQVTTGAAAPDARCVHGGADGILQTVAAGDDFARALHEGRFILSPRSADTDLDGLTDGRELALGTNPNARDAGSITDSDQDGLYDAEETNGWLVSINGAAAVLVTSNPLRPDTDADGLPDVYEQVLGTNPRLTDSDADGLRDSREVAMADSRWSDAQRITAQTRCEGAVRCTFTEASTPTRSDPRLSDTDADTLSDSVEVNGWVVLVGSVSRNVTSSPSESDTDMDGLGDGEEFTRRTDPRDVDTDDDGGTDAYELSPPAGWGVGPRNPTAPDRWVASTVSGVVFGDCDDTGSDRGDFAGGSVTSNPAGRVSYDFGFYCRLLGGEGRACRAAPSSYFIMRSGESFTFESNALREIDGSGGDEALGSWAPQTVTFSDVSGGSFARTHSFRESDTCGINATANFEVR